MPGAASGHSVLFITQVPHMAIDGQLFEFPDDGSGTGLGISLFLNRHDETEAYSALNAALESFGAAEAFGALLAVVGSRKASVAVWMVSGFDGLPDADTIGDAFWTECVSVLDEVSFAYRVVTSRGVGEVSPELMRHPVFYVVFIGEEATDMAGSLYRPQEGYDDAVAGQLLDEMTEVVVARDHGQPFFEQRRWFERMRDDLAHHAGAPAIISLQTGVESFFSELRELLILDTRTRGAEEPHETVELSFKWNVQSVGRWVGYGNWDVTAATPLGRYWTDLYHLRNRVIHDSYRPTEQEVAAALMAHDEMRDWLGDLLFQQPRLFPRTLLGFPGVAVLTGTGRMTNYLRSRAEHYSQPGMAYWTDDPE